MRKVKQRQIPAPRFKTIVKARIDDDGIVWMNAYEVNGLTNWDRRKLENLRDNGRLTYRKDGKKVEYDINSVLRIFEIEKKFDQLR